MGLHERGPSNVNYLNIINGKIAQRFKTQVPGTESREIKDDKGNVTKVVFEKYYEKIDGSLTKAFFKSGEYGHSLEFVITDEGVNYQLSVPLASGYGRSVLFRIPNIDHERKVCFRPYNFTDKDTDKKISGVSIIQEGRGWDKDSVPAYWTKDDQKKLPPLEVKEVLGKKKYDDSDRTTYLVGVFNKWAATINTFGVDESQVDNTPDPMEMERKFAEEKAGKVSTMSPEEEDDDLPF